MSKDNHQILVIPREEFEKRGPFNGYLPLVNEQGEARQDVGEYLGRGDSSGESIAHFMRRGDAEQDPSFKQIIPYAVILCGKSVLTYTRARGGNEDRLHDKLSIGIGGHIDSTDDSDPFWAYMKGLRRELNEEIGLDMDFNNLKGTLHGLVNDDYEGEESGKVAVGRVHLGLVHIICINEHMAKQVLENTEKLEIDNPRFVLIEEFGKDEFLRNSLENWSGYIADKLVADLQIEGPWTRPDVRERLQFLAVAASKVAAAAGGLLLQEDTRGWLLSKENLEQVLGEFHCMFAGVAAHEDVEPELVTHHGHQFRALLPTCTKHQDFGAPDSASASAS